MPAPFAWKKFESDIRNVDPDFRQMALFDLQQHLAQSSEPLSSDAQKLCANVIINSFGPRERNTEVHSNALRVVGPIASRMEAKLLQSVVSKLVEYITDSAAQHDGAQELTLDNRRQMVENSGVALKIVAEAVPDAFNPTLITPLVTFVERSSGQQESKVLDEIYSVLTVVVHRAGKGLASLHKPLLHAICGAWPNASTVLQRQQATCIAELSPHLDGTLYASLLDWSRKCLAADDGTKLRMQVHLVSLLLAASSSRWDEEALGSFVTRLIAVLDNLQMNDEDESESIVADELRDVVLRCFTSLLRYCGRRVAACWDAIATATERLMDWDPNYVALSDEDVDDMNDEEDDMYDDGDISWRVRRSTLHVFEEAYKTLALPGVIRRRLFALPDERLVKRMEDRVDAVKHGALQLASLVMFTDAASSAAAAGDVAPVEVPIRVAIKKSLRSKDSKVQLAAISAFGALFATMGASPEIVLDAVGMAGTLSGAKTQGSVWAECLLVVSEVVRGARPLLSDASLSTSVEGLLPIARARAQDAFQKTAVAALALVVALVDVLEFLPNKAAMSTELLNIAIRCLSSSDAMVRLAAVDGITAMYILKAIPRDSMTTVSQNAVAVMMEMLQNDTTAPRTARSLGTIASGLDGKAQVMIVKALVGLVSRSNPAIRDGALRALRTVFEHPFVCDSTTANDIARALCDGVAPPMSDKDIALAALAVSLSAVMAQCESMVPIMVSKVAPCVLQVLSVASMPATVSTDAAEALGVLASQSKISVASLTDRALNDALMASTDVVALRLATAAAALGSREKDHKRSKAFVATCVDAAKAAGVDAGQRAASGVMVLGEVGAIVPLSEDIEEVLLNSLRDSRDVVYRAGEHALGRAASAPWGQSLLAKLLQRLRKGDASERYTQLRALRATVINAVDITNSPIEANATLRDELVVALYASVTSADSRGYVDTVGDTLAHLARLAPQAAMHGLLTDLSSPDPQKKLVAVATLKYTLFTLRQEDDEMFIPPLTAALGLLKHDAPLALRSELLHLIATVVHRRAALLAKTTLLSSALKELIVELQVDPQCVDIINLGPFQHVEDRGLEARKAAFDCLAALLEHAHTSETSPLTQDRDVACDVLKQLILTIAVVAKPTEEQKRTMESDIDNKVTAAQCIDKFLRLPATVGVVVQQADPLCVALKAWRGKDEATLEMRELTIYKIVGSIQRRLREEPYAARHAAFASLPALAD